MAILPPFSGDAGLTLIMFMVFRCWTGRLRLRPTSARRQARGINVPSLCKEVRNTPVSVTNRKKSLDFFIRAFLHSGQYRPLPRMIVILTPGAMTGLRKDDSNHESTRMDTDEPDGFRKGPAPRLKEAGRAGSGFFRKRTQRANPYGFEGSAGPHTLSGTVMIGLPTSDAEGGVISKGGNAKVLLHITVNRLSLKRARHAKTRRISSAHKACQHRLQHGMPEVRNGIVGTLTSTRRELLWQTNLLATGMVI